MTALVSEKLQAAFVHVPRTGGTSIAAALCDMDVDADYRGFQGTDEDLAALIDWSMPDIPKEASGKFTFCVVRHPYTRLLSLHNFYQARDACRSFEEFLYGLKPKGTHAPQTWFAEGCDFVGKFEDIEGAWAEICSRLGVEEPELPHMNESYPMGELTQEAKDIIYEKYAEDFHVFGYDQ